METNFRLVEYNDNLDLTEFYHEAKLRGFENNSSKKIMVDSLAKEKEWKLWILYSNDIACGSIGYHSLDIMGENSYRICARTCFFRDFSPNTGMYTRKSFITEHQHATHQILIPQCIKKLGVDKNLYLTTNDSPVASQNVVHSVWAPNVSKLGLLEKVTTMEYRGHVQTFWKLDGKKFLEDLEKYPRWVFQC